jgi:hypothetical protein
VSKPWVAESAADVIWQKVDNGFLGRPVLIGIDPMEQSPHLLAKEVRQLVAEVRAAVSEFVGLKTASVAEISKVAANAIQLAKLDSVYRAQVLEPTFKETSPEDVQDLLALLAVVPFNELLHPTTLRLNPDFGPTSHLVGGADADLISGDLLIDMKTTKKGEVVTTDLDQLFGYFLLARRQHSADPSFPQVRRVALYFSRHAHLLPIDTTAWTTHPDFAAVEKWFFQRAEQEYSTPK